MMLCYDATPVDWRSAPLGKEIGSEEPEEPATGAPDVLPALPRPPWGRGEYRFPSPDPRRAVTRRERSGALEPAGTCVRADGVRAGGGRNMFSPLAEGGAVHQDETRRRSSGAASEQSRPCTRQKDHRVERDLEPRELLGPVPPRSRRGLNLDPGGRSVPGRDGARPRILAPGLRPPPPTRPSPPHPPFLLPRSRGGGAWKEGRLRLASPKEGRRGCVSVRGKGARG